jgi:hypothetical protein
MKRIPIFCVFLLIVACKRAHSVAEVRKELSKAMLTSLWTDHNKDTSKVKFEILDVNYFEDTTFFECEYKVHMHIVKTGFDTVGMMAARVSKDFITVKRKL